MVTWKPTTEPATGCEAGGKAPALMVSEPPPDMASSSSHHEFHDTDDTFSSWKQQSITLLGYKYQNKIYIVICINKNFIMKPILYRNLRSEIKLKLN